MVKDKDYYLRRATEGFKTLVIYTCVCKPQYESAYKKDGKFSLEELLRQKKFLSEWKSKSAEFRKKYHAIHVRYSKTDNFTFSIPSRLIDNILGDYSHGEGITRAEVVQKLVDEGWLEVKNHGGKHWKTNSGEKCGYGFSTKYLIKDFDEWKRMITNPRYRDFWKIEEDDNKFVVRAKNIIRRWREKHIKKEKKYAGERELMFDFFTDKIDETEFRVVGKQQFKMDSDELDAVISRKRGMTNGNPETKENETRTDNQDKQGKAFSDETPSPIEVADNPAPSGQGEKPICLDCLVQETQGLQKTAN